MGKISRIQLRGISRSPSDRMTEDGGVAESLNVQLNDSEIAPSFIPEDATVRLGLPAELNAERIFVHKTANYENYIAIQGDRVVAYTPSIEDEEPLTVLDLAGGESVVDINSLGNTIIISTTHNLYYALYKDNSYNFLGNKIPFPHIKFYRKNGKYRYKQYKKDWSNSLTVPFPFSDRLPNGEPQNPSTPMDFGASGIYYPEDLGVYSFYEIDKAKWDAKDPDGNTNKIVKSFLEEREKLIKELTQEDKSILPFFIRYSIVLYDGLELSSMPILISPDKKAETTLQTNMEMLYNTSGNLYMVSLSGFNLINIGGSSCQKLGFELEQEEETLTQWSDIVDKIRIYISNCLPSNEVPLSSYIQPSGDVYKLIEEGSFSHGSSVYSRKKTLSQQGVVTFDKVKDYEEEILKASADEFLVKEIQVFDRKGVVSFSDEFNEFLKTLEIDISQFTDKSNENYQQLEVQEMLRGDDMKHYTLVPSKMEQYNNRLLLTEVSQLLDYDYNSFTSYRINNTEGTDRYQFDVTYLIKTTTKDKVVKKSFAYDYGDKIYSFQIFPDSRAYKMLVKAIKTTSGNVATTSYGVFDMHPHPYLDCSYYYGGLDIELVELCTEGGIEDYSVDAIELLGNKLLVSEQDNPFIFPINSRFTFLSKVLGVSIATTALSQGQFGQFPLYVFAQDGIWAMETAADGSFVTSKPLSREVCINPDSITPLDNAVVFVTAQGVMMLQGSQVVNISPNMNGRHYQIENSARTIIENQDFFCDLLPALSDNTHFLAFVKEATVAYDYAGRRLIFIKKDEKYQYIYKLDTQTWHKGAYDVDLVAPINSYPECLVQGKKEGKTRIYDLSTILDAAESKTPVRGVIATRPFDLGEPDIFKTITDVRIRGQFPKGAVKFILLGSNDGINFATVSTLRGRSWKLFRMILLADLAPTERISWIDIMYETRFTNKLR